jgi:hypothetical protein
LSFGPWVTLEVSFPRPFCKPIRPAAIPSTWTSASYQLSNSLKGVAQTLLRTADELKMPAEMPDARWDCPTNRRSIRSGKVRPKLKLNEEIQLFAGNSGASSSRTPHSFDRWSPRNSPRLARTKITTAAPCQLDVINHTNCKTTGRRQCRWYKATFALQLRGRS